MNILSFNDVMSQLEHKQVFFKKEIVNSDFKTIVLGSKVHNVGAIDINRLNDDVISFRINVNEIELVLYEYKTDVEFFAYINTNFIPFDYILAKYNE